mmetsp:Transcript_166717/g.320089  ORF Transcript_166717/g.320089 Transcript_166717/m.320089 type:complete len:285 (-) Transcript_166717:40-894(-)
MSAFGGRVCLSFSLLGMSIQRCSADGHGVYCSTQFNWWYKFAPGAKEKLLTLAAPSNADLSVCDMKDNANALYHQLVEKRGMGLPLGGGMNKKCQDRNGFNIGMWHFGELGGIPAGGCAFSYPDVSHSTCRLKIFGPDEVLELQWCQMSIQTSMKVAKGSDGTSNPDHDLSCEEHTDFEVAGSEEHGDGDKHPYVSRFILMEKFINTLVEMPDCESAAKSSTVTADSSLNVWLFVLIGTAGALAGALAMLGAVLLIQWRGKMCNKCLVKPLCPRSETSPADTSA